MTINRKLFLLTVLTGCAHAQTCVYQTGKFPNGTVIVYRNGAIQRQGTDFQFKVIAGLPTITPINWTPGDKFSTVFSIQVPLTAGTLSYTSFRAWQENWDCPGTAPIPPTAPWVLTSATFANPPINPQVNQAFMFTDANSVDSCQGGGNGSMPQICYWSGKEWLSPTGTQSPVAVLSLPGGRRTVRNLECFSGIVDKSMLTATAPIQEVTILGALNGAARFEHVTLCEREKFAGQATMTVSMGRPGSSNYELSGTVVPLGASANNQGCWTAQPTAPQFSGTYSIVLNFSVAPGNVADLSAGSVEWEACMYPSLIGDPGIVMTPAKLIGLQQCAGSSQTWDCSGILRANIGRTDGSILSLVGVSMAATGGIWTPLK